LSDGALDSNTKKSFAFLTASLILLAAALLSHPLSFAIFAIAFALELSKSFTSGMI
jgi:hypothetical protein